MRKLLFLFIAISCSAPEPAEIDDRLVVYPNPASDFAYIDVRPASTPHKITAFNADGTINFQFGVGVTAQYPIRLDLKSEGTYHVVLEVNGQTISKDILRLNK